LDRFFGAILKMAGIHLDAKSARRNSYYNRVMAPLRPPRRQSADFTAQVCASPEDIADQTIQAEQESALWDPWMDRVVEY